MAYDMINHLQIIINTTSEEDISVNIAKALLESVYSDIETLTIGELAEKAHTSVSTISRFTKTLDCDSFNELKKKLLQRKKLGKEIIEDSLENMKFDNHNDREILDSFVSSMILDLKNFIENIDLDEIDDLIELIHNYEKVNFFGIQITGALVEHLQFLFLNMGKFINFKAQEKEQEELAKMTDENTLSIIFSVDGNYLHTKGSMFYDIKDNKGTIVLITQNPALKLSNKCDKVIYLGDYNNAKNGRYKLQLLLDIVANRYFLKYKEEIKSLT